MNKNQPSTPPGCLDSLLMAYITLEVALLVTLGPLVLFHLLTN